MKGFHFRRKLHKAEEQDFILESVQTKKGSAWAQVLVKSLLVTMLVFGSLGGLLAAYEISYQIAVGIAVIFGISFLFSAVYATQKRWLINIFLLAALGGYFAYAFRFYWYINSGYYGLLNHILEEARVYLAIFNGTEYDLVMGDEYLSVTHFVIFVGVIAVMLLQIHFSRRYHLFLVAALTFPFYIIPMYFEKNPGAVYWMLLFAGYAMVAMLHALQGGEENRRKWWILLGMVIAFAMCARLLMWIVPLRIYRANISQSAWKKQSESQVSNLVQSGLLSAFGGGSAGMSGGVLGGGSVTPDYETDLVVEFTPYSYEPVYLKAFLGVVYDGSRWITPEEAGVEPDFWTEETLRGLEQKDSPQWAEGKMSVQNVGADGEYVYVPYYTDVNLTREDGDGEPQYTFYPYRADMHTVTGEVADAYLEVPDRCLDAVAATCGEGGFGGDAEEIAAQVVDFFAERYAYTLNPGYQWGGDYITHFLRNSRRGYCMHFASAGTMLLRYMGIPARYVEGYVFSYGDVLVDGELVEDAEYADYYSGYAALGETGLVRLEIPDANAHAWVEIYVDGKGWIVVDPTPAAGGEESDSFWDAFRERNQQSDGNGIFNVYAAEYLEQVVDSAVWVLLGVVTVLLLWIVAKQVRSVRRERSLPPRERVCFRYRREVARRSRQMPGWKAGGTIHSQLQELNRMAQAKRARRWGRKRAANEARWTDLEEELYLAFYGREAAAEVYESLYRRLRAVSRETR